jgi:hypothetical protein
MESDFGLRETEVGTLKQLNFPLSRWKFVSSACETLSVLMFGSVCFVYPIAGNAIESVASCNQDPPRKPATPSDTQAVAPSIKMLRAQIRIAVPPQKEESCRHTTLGHRVPK